MSFLGKQWPAQLDSRLVELVQKGMGSGQIATQLNAEFGTNVTRNSVGGRVFRMRKTMPEHAELRLTFQYGKSGDEWGGRKITIEQRRIAIRRRWKEWESRQTKDTMDAIKSARIAATKRRNAERRLAMTMQHSDNAVHFVDRTREQCCWPLWCDGAPYSELMVCGTKTEATGPYCPAHAYRASNWVRGEFTPMKANRWSIHPWKSEGRAA